MSQYPSQKHPKLDAKIPACQRPGTRLSKAVFRAPPRFRHDPAGNQSSGADFGKYWRRKESFGANFVVLEQALKSRPLHIIRRASAARTQGER
jgi:hypothetical protein